MGPCRELGTPSIPGGVRYKINELIRTQHEGKKKDILGYPEGPFLTS